MTKAVFDIRRNTFKIDVNGHAGHEDPRVCAGASMLTCTLIEAMKREFDNGNLIELSANAEPNASIRALSTDYGRKRVQTVADTIAAGFDLLAAMYPENVSICRR